MSENYEVYMHDVENAVAVIQVREGETVFTNTYDLMKVFPGTSQVLALLGLELTEEAQQRAIEYVVRQVALQMAGPNFPGDPIPNPIVEGPPPEPGPDNEEVYVQVEPAPPVKPHESLVPMPLPEEETEDGDAGIGGDQPVAG